MNCIVFILRRLNFSADRYVDQNYGEDFIEMNEQKMKLSVKLIRPSLICHVTSVMVHSQGTMKYVAQRQFLSEFVDAPFVLYFVKPVRDGSPTVIPVVESPTLEKDVVKSFFFCLGQLGFKLSRRALPGTRECLPSLSQRLTDGAEIVSHISSHLLSEVNP
jgi:hypothetical protein